VRIADDDFGGLVMADGFLYAATTNAAQVLKIDPTTFTVLARYSLPSPAGGLGYDKERGVLIAQLYVEHPNLAVLDLKTGKVIANLWSDESAMGLAKVDGDWLCTWASGWDPGSFSELRVIDQQTGKVRSRMRLDGVHSVISPDADYNGKPTFLSVITLDSYTGKTVIRRYSYTGEHRSSQASSGF
jgi:glutamine cyclotransferase